MRKVRTISLLAGLAALVLASSSALACPGTQTRVSGSFDATGHFVLSGAWNKDGAAIENSAGMTLASFTTAENLVIPASTLAGKNVCLWGDLDVAHKTMSVAGYQECPAGACDPASCMSKGASAAAAGAGTCPAQGASASAAGAGSCAAKGTSASAAGAGQCAAKGASASAASAGGCCAAGNAAKSASAGSCEKGAAAASTKMAAASTLVYKVSGMTCGGCASKVQGAVSKMANVSNCTVDLEKAQAVVTTSGEVDTAAIQKAITAAGFPAELAPAEAAKS